MVISAFFSCILKSLYQMENKVCIHKTRIKWYARNELWYKPTINTDDFHMDQKPVQSISRNNLKCDYFRCKWLYTYLFVRLEFILLSVFRCIDCYQITKKVEFQNQTNVEGLRHKIWYPLVWQTRWHPIRMTTFRSSQTTLTSPIDPQGFHCPLHCLRNYNPVCGMQERQEPVSLKRAESPLGCSTST